MCSFSFSVTHVWVHVIITSTEILPDASTHLVASTLIFRHCFKRSRGEERVGEERVEKRREEERREEKGEERRREGKGIKERGERKKDLTLQIQTYSKSRSTKCSL